MGFTGGSRSFDIIRQVVGNVVNFINKRPTPCTAPCDGWVLKMHYQWTFWIFLGGFTAIWQSWYHKDVIVCTSKFNAENQVRLDYLNICLSFPFIEKATGVEYLLFYRWIHWVMLILGGLFYLVRKLSKRFENCKVKKLFEDLVPNIIKYDHSGDAVERTGRYLSFNMGGHDFLFYKYLVCNIFALILDIFSFFILDFCLNNKFLNLGYDAYPFTKDIVNFSDPLSQAFPPFARCDLHERTEITFKRTEQFGCHLTVMEMYEKVFVALWIYLIAVTTTTACYILYLFLFLHPVTRRLIFKPTPSVSAKDCDVERVNEALGTYKVGDFYLLYRLQSFIPHPLYYKLLLNITDRDFQIHVMEKVAVFPRLQTVVSEKPPFKSVKKTRNKIIENGYLKHNKGLLVE